MSHHVFSKPGYVGGAEIAARLTAGERGYAAVDPLSVLVQAELGGDHLAAYIALEGLLAVDVGNMGAQAPRVGGDKIAVRALDLGAVVQRGKLVLVVLGGRVAKVLPANNFRVSWDCLHTCAKSNF